MSKPFLQMTLAGYPYFKAAAMFALLAILHAGMQTGHTSGSASAANPASTASPAATASPPHGQARHQTTPSILLDDQFILDASKAIDLLYNRNYNSSLNALESWKEAMPEHPLWPLLEAIESWWPVLIDLENTSYDDVFLQKAQVVADLCNQILKEHPDHLDALIIRSIINGQIARYHSNRYRWLQSFRHARRALRDFFLVESSYPELPDIQFGIGMYRYFAAFLVEEYTLARPLKWMLPAGDRQEGLARLKAAADSSIFMEPEATYFLGHIYLHYEREPDLALEYLERLYHRYPDNSYYQRLYIRSLFQLRHFDDALVAIEENLNRPSVLPPHQSPPELSLLDTSGRERLYPTLRDESGTASQAGRKTTSPEEHNPPVITRHEVLALREDLLTLRGQIHYHRLEYDLAESDFLKAVAEAEKLAPFAQRSNLITSLFFLGELSIRNNERINARYYFSRAATPDIDHHYVKRAREALRKHRLR